MTERIAALMGIGFVKLTDGKIMDAIVAEAEHAPALPTISPAETSTETVPQRVLSSKLAGHRGRSRVNLIRHPII